jgi:hypothetical protein
MSAVATLVERQSRFVMLIGLPDGHTADVVADALAAKIIELPTQLRRSITWDHGKEMAPRWAAALVVRSGSWPSDSHCSRFRPCGGQWTSRSSGIPGGGAGPSRPNRDAGRALVSEQGQGDDASLAVAERAASCSYSPSLALMLERAKAASHDVVTQIDDVRRRRTAALVLELDLTEPLVEGLPLAAETAIRFLDGRSRSDLHDDENAEARAHQARGDRW